MDENSIIPYIEPIFRFCCHKLSNRYDAEDLASEIICHILDGIKKYKIESLDAWVWRIAHNRYARFIDARNKNLAILSETDNLLDIADNNYCYVDEEATEDEYHTVFLYLHTLSSEYRNIFVDYYIGELSIRQLAQKYSLPETTIKWRLNVGRQKIRERIGENKMDRVYQRINWNTTCCNGYMDSDKYLHTQIARAICQAAYEKPLTVEEISINTGIPAMYIEDELPRLLYGDAICQIGNKYATNFIIFRLTDRKDTEGVSAHLVKEIADRLETMLTNGETILSTLSFYGHDFGMERLGYFLIPYLLRKTIRSIKNTRLNLSSGPYPPRKDGGYGWFIVEETVDKNENCAEYNTGCNATGDDNAIYYYWISKYFESALYHNGGARWLYSNGILLKSKDGIIPKDTLNNEDASRLLKNNLIIKDNDNYKFNFACFTHEEFTEFVSSFNMNDEKIETMLTEWILTVHKSFEKFIPARLHDQINQYLSSYLYQIIGYVIDELILRGKLKKPDLEKPLTDGIFYVEGKYINP